MAAFNPTLCILFFQIAAPCSVVMARISSQFGSPARACGREVTSGFLGESNTNFFASGFLLTVCSNSLLDSLAMIRMASSHDSINAFSPGVRLSTSNARSSVLAIIEAISRSPLPGEAALRIGSSACVVLSIRTAAATSSDKPDKSWPPISVPPRSGLGPLPRNTSTPNPYSFAILAIFFVTS